MTSRPRAARARVLRDRAVFETILRAGRRISSRNFVLRAHPNALEHPRLGVIAGRKAAARAVDRNRGKRLIREAFRAAAAGLGAVDVAIQLRNDLRRESARDLRLELDGLLGRLGREGISSAGRSN